ncbi:hypothetical protein KMZ32_06145 [Phycicoccus sp. MAQZ13P-2]|uniref:hypothetical protein n=1 Tax=Phycicoccus mangrovi TaxID=2840470 RepID=UPI001C003ED8|nr:hypothetical protein [Phycicoccus mangrovi]MBT9273653.1 hypothetical protein [Phycicoccus mangrovi]
MSVPTQLGLGSLDEDLLVQARDRWPSWGRQYPALAAVGDLTDLPGWLPAADPAAADDVLHALAVLASPRGGDDLAAAGTLAWVLLPGACVVAYRLRTLTSRIDELVAAQLWLEVRSFAWERRRKVAANIVMNTRRGVLRDLEVGEHGREVDATWAQAVPVQPDAELWTALEAQRYSAPTNRTVELGELLEWAVRAGVVERRDLDLLHRLSVAACQADPTHNHRGRGGLFSQAARAAVAADVGGSEATIRRRATAALEAIAAARAQMGAVA